MIDIPLYLQDGTQLTTGYNRVVRGKRGDYVEFEKNHLCVPLLSKFSNDMEKDNPGYYYWLYPIGKPNVKVYLQVQIVKYADYRIGKYYIAPNLLLNFKDIETLF